MSVTWYKHWDTYNLRVLLLGIYLRETVEHVHQEMYKMMLLGVFFLTERTGNTQTYITHFVDQLISDIHSVHYTAV